MEVLQDGVVYVAHGDKDLVIVSLEGSVVAMVTAPLKDQIYTPSIERSMDSAIDVFKERTIGVILTGMGNDGTPAVKRLYDMGGHTIAESEETAVIYGMPKSVVDLNAARIVAPLEKIAGHIANAVKQLNPNGENR
jgi:two-component system chemotaxis response regulator CheB